MKLRKIPTQTGLSTPFEMRRAARPSPSLQTTASIRSICGPLPVSVKGMFNNYFIDIDLSIQSVQNVRLTLTWSFYAECSL